jgi:hypothetical protein
MKSVFETGSRNYDGLEVLRLHPRILTLSALVLMLHPRILRLCIFSSVAKGEKIYRTVRDLRSLRSLRGLRGLRSLRSSEASEALEHG